VLCRPCSALLSSSSDFINPKTGRKIFACGHFHDHAAKDNQSSYPWSQCVVAIGLLKQIKSRWACLPLSFSFYLMKKDIEAERVNSKRRGEVMVFNTKMHQAATMLMAVYDHFKRPVLIVTDSWFGNDGLWSRLDRGQNGAFHLLSRLRTNITLYDLTPMITDGTKNPRGRRRKYGNRLGSADECATENREKAQTYSVFLYGKQRNVQAFAQVVMLKTLKCPIHVVWVYRQSRYVALFTTDLSLSNEQIIEFYGARWKIEAEFKEIKQDIGSARSQTRNADAVNNHLSLEERHYIEISMKSGQSLKQIANHLDRAQSTISREVKRNHRLRGYRHQQANKCAIQRIGSKNLAEMTFP
jgi:hypothetical protein